MSSRGFHNLPVKLALGCVRFMDPVSISRFSRICKSLYYVLHDKRQEAAKEFALLPTRRAPRCPEMPEFQNWRFIPRWFTHPKPSESHVEMAIVENRMDSLRAFLAAGVDPNSFGTGGRRLLGTAIWYGRLDAMNVLFEYKVDIDLLLYQDPPEETLNISSAIRYACAYGMFGIGIHLCWEGVVDYEIDLISPLLQAGCKLDAIGYETIRKRRDLCRILQLSIDHGFMPENLVLEDSHPLYPADVGFPTLVCAFCGVASDLMGQEVSPVDKISCLSQILARQPQVLTDELYKATGDFTLLHQCILLSHWEGVLALLESGAEVGKTCPFYHFEGNELERVEFLEYYWAARRSCEDVESIYREVELLEDLKIKSRLEMRLQLT